ncbi:hypothetical protein B14911_05079 [Bacillus sp. NRRL B-14911]|nr:hypothetical protein B14911_05079 [Bacillus sp. NRRL B-14911]
MNDHYLEGVYKEIGMCFLMRRRYIWRFFKQIKKPESSIRKIQAS